MSESDKILNLQRLTLAPDGWAALQPDGHFIGLWQSEAVARTAIDPKRNGNSGKETVRPMWFGRTRADVGLAVRLHQQACDLWAEINAIDTVLGDRERALQKAAALRDALGRL